MAQARDWRGRFASGGGMGSSRSVSVGRGKNKGTARVTRIKNGRTTRPSRYGARLATGGAISRRVGARPGTPLAGNKNVRFVSRTHAIARATSFPGSNARGMGKVHSNMSVRSPVQPRNGYVVSYGPRK